MEQLTPPKAESPPPLPPIIMSSYSDADSAFLKAMRGSDADSVFLQATRGEVAHSRSRPTPKHPSTTAFSLAAIVRFPSRSTQDSSEQRYVLVHERPPRGWWLPGGGIERKDSTPVDAAVRETVEEAAAVEIHRLQNENRLPIMTHLLSVQQSLGRIRFIFRGRWSDDSNTALKLPPGDKDSIEAKWVTLDEVKSLPVSQRSANHNPSVTDGQWGEHPWLRGHEPITFFEMLERSWTEDQSIPGLPVHTDSTIHNSEVIGAFFTSMHRAESSSESRISHRGREELITNLQATAVVYRERDQTFAVDGTTLKFLSRCVTNQYAQTLKELVHEMLEDFMPKDKNDIKAGILRMEYTKHESGNEATLTVFPYLIISLQDKETQDVTNTTRWVSVYELDRLERQLATEVIKNHIQLGNVDVLRDRE